MEKRLWYRLRDRQIEGYKFRRQHPVMHYVLDFACDEAKLGIELDGGQHVLTQNQQLDAERTQELAKLGWSVLRFWNNEVVENMDGVLEVIRLNLVQKAPSPENHEG